MIHKRLTTREKGAARFKSQNGLQRRELSQESRIPCQQGIRVNYFNEYREACLKNILLTP